MSEDAPTPEHAQQGKIVYQHKGPIYNRPCGRGICLTDTDPELYLEDLIPDGDYYIEVVVRRFPLGPKSVE